MSPTTHPRTASPVKTPQTFHSLSPITVPAPPSASSTSSTATPIASNSPGCLRTLHRGRRVRPSSLSSSLHQAVHYFCQSVGAPKVLPSTGCRDFRGWLIRLASINVIPSWNALLAALAKDLNFNLDTVEELKEDVVRAIVKYVVIPRPGESRKLVSTNAGRQSSRSRPGQTLMKLLEQHVRRLQNHIPALVRDHYGTCAEVQGQRGESRDHSQEKERRDRKFTESIAQTANINTNVMVPPKKRETTRHTTANQMARTPAPPPSRLPSVNEILKENNRLNRGHWIVHTYGRERTLPSFSELEASLRRGSL